MVVGDALLDRDVIGEAHRLCPDSPAPVVENVTEQLRPGGAGLAALLAARDGHEVVLVTALGADTAGESLRALLSAEMEVVATTTSAGTPQKVRIRVGEQSLVRVDYGSTAGKIGRISATMRHALTGAGTVLVADYGYGLTADRTLRTLLGNRRSDVPLVWDPHPRGSTPVAGAALATPNLAEAEHFTDLGLVTAEKYAAALRSMWSVPAIAVTLGADGALLDDEGRQTHIPVQPSSGDTCGAGDRFSATVAACLHAGATLQDAAVSAVAAAEAYVAAGGPAMLQRRLAAVPANQ